MPCALRGDCDSQAGMPVLWQVIAHAACVVQVEIPGMDDAVYNLQGRKLVLDDAVPKSHNTRTQFKTDTLGTSNNCLHISVIIAHAACVVQVEIPGMDDAVSKLQ
jgi:hypothetical protein